MVWGRMRGRPRRGLAIAGLVAVLSCRESAGLHGEGAPASNAGAPAPAGAQAPRTHAPRGPVSEAEALKPRPDLPPAERALVVIGAVPAQPGPPRSRGSPRRAGQPAKPGEERWIDAELAEAAGYTLVDLRDDWTPYIFAEQLGPDGQPLPNRYRRIFIGLANDELDEDGEPLPPGTKNYLELYGIFPLDVGPAGAVPRRRAAPLPGSGERRRARRRRDGHLRRPGRHQEGRAPPGADSHGAGGGAQEGARRDAWTTWRRSSRPSRPR